VNFIIYIVFPNKIKKKVHPTTNSYYPTTPSLRYQIKIFPRHLFTGSDYIWSLLSVIPDEGEWTSEIFYSSENKKLLPRVMWGGSTFESPSL